MHGTMPEGGRGRDVRSASVTDQSDSDGANDWFVSVCEHLLPKDAGFALSMLKFTVRQLRRFIPHLACTAGRA